MTAPFLQRRRRLLIWLGALFATFSLAGFFLAPVILKQQLIKHASLALHRPVSIEQVRVNPWTLSVTVRGLAVTDHDGSELAGWDEFFADFQASSLFRRTWYFDTVRFARPRGRLVIANDGALNIADLVPPPAAAPEPKDAQPQRPPPFAMAHFIVEHGEFSFLDSSRHAPFETHLGPTSFTLQNFTTRPKRSGDYTFAATTESGETLAWHGTMTFEPLGSAGHLELSGLALPKYAPFYRNLLRFDIAAGTLALAADYEIALAAEPVARLTHGNAVLTDLRLAAPEAAAPFLTLPELRVENLAADSAAYTASVDRLLVRGAAITAERRADGSFDLAELLTPAGATAHTAPSTAHSSPSTEAWSATLASLEIADASLHLTDHTTPRPANIVIDQLALTVTGASTQLDREVALTTSLRWNGAGRVAVSGQVRPQPLSGALEVEATDIALRPLDPYLAPFVDVLITSGTARAHGQLTFGLADSSAPDLHWTGDAGLADFATVDAVASEPFVGFTDLAFNHIDATTRPLAVTLDEIALKAPFARVVVLPDRSLNLMAALKGANPTETTTPPTAAEPVADQPNSPATAHSSPVTAPLITIGKVTITDGRFSATDRSVDPVFTRELIDFGGTISGLSSAQLARADVDLSGKLGRAPLRISGQINPLAGDAFSDVKVTFTGIELPPFTPYSGRFAGYTIDKGKLSLDLSYHLSARELVAENNVVLDQFYLGQPVASPDATKLPVKLALAILRGPDGRIPVDLPIRGNLDDPDFKYGRVVMRALGNLLVKAATAPFSLLGGMFGGGHDLSAVDFASGSSTLDDEAVARLDGLAKALTNRPALSLEIASLPQPELDLAGLRETQLDALLRARRLRELAAATTEAIDPAAVSLSPEDTARLLAVLHAERCPPATPDSAVAPLPDASATSGETTAAKQSSPSASKKTGNLLTRTVRRLFGSEEKATAQTAATVAPPVEGGESVAAGPSLEQLRADLLATFTPTAEDFATLATQRAEHIQEYLVTTGGVDPARVFLATGEEGPAASEVPRVVFNLK